MPALLQAAPAAPSLVANFAPLLLIIGLGYFLLWRPAQVQRRQLADMRGALKPGDEVLTKGGLYGAVTKLRDDRVHVRIADGVQVEVARGAIEAVVTPKPRE